MKSKSRLPLTDFGYKCVKRFLIIVVNDDLTPLNIVLFQHYIFFSFDTCLVSISMLVKFGIYLLFHVGQIIVKQLHSLTYSMSVCAIVFPVLVNRRTNDLNSVQRFTNRPKPLNMSVGSQPYARSAFLKYRCDVSLIQIDSPRRYDLSSEERQCITLPCRLTYNEHGCLRDVLVDCVCVFLQILTDR